MSFTLRAAPSSRVTKSKPKKSAFNRSETSPFTRFHKTKLLTRSLSKPETSTLDHDEDDSNARLPNLGPIRPLPRQGSSTSSSSKTSSSKPRDILGLIGSCCASVFDEMPQRAGMNSTRIAEVLNYRVSLPPLVSKAHIHALVTSPTQAEREIASLIAQGKLRKIVIPGRGIRSSLTKKGSASNLSPNTGPAFEALIPTEAWIEVFERATSLSLDPLTRDKYKALLRNDLLPSPLTPEERISLFHASFLVSPTPSTLSGTSVFDSVTSTTYTSIASISRAASGSLNAIGGANAVHSAGGGSGSLSDLQQRSLSDSSDAFDTGAAILPAVPNTARYLRLLHAAVAHLLTLLSRSPHREAPLSLLKERWEGGIAGSVEDAASRRARMPYGSDPFGPGGGEILPGRTKKWKSFYGMRFEWVVEEAVGWGVVEVFETGSVGLGIKAV
ncbi:hypothetical protein MMC25_007447 [Agyrium rufum]|nr:hypothetical protein [Agyrium rufum]